MSIFLFFWGKNMSYIWSTFVLNISSNNKIQQINFRNFLTFNLIWLIHQNRNFITKLILVNFIIRGAFKGKTMVLRKCKQWCAMAAASIMVVLPGLNSRRLPNHVLHMFLEKNRLVIILFPITFILKTFLSLLILFQKGPLLFLVFYPSPMSRRLSDHLIRLI